MSVSVTSKLSRREGFSNLIAGWSRNWWVIVTSALVLGLLAFAVSVFQSPVYKATATLYVTAGSGESNAQSAYQGSLASQQKVASYARLVTSEAVLSAALGGLASDVSIDQARKSVYAETVPQTVLLNVTAEDENPATAARVANGVSNSMVSYVKSLERPDGSDQSLAKLTVVTPAAVPSEPSSPNVLRNSILGMLAGAVLGVGLAFGRMRLDDQVRLVTDLEGEGRPAVMGVVPNADLLDAEVIDHSDPGAHASLEAYRKIRTNLTFANVDSPPRLILVTSAIQSEGKTTTAIGIATALVESGNRVLLMDADLRRPTVASRFGLNRDVGLTDFLRGEGEIHDYVQAAASGGPFVLGAGGTPPNPAELLGSERFRAGTKQLVEMFDYVIVDSAPVLPVADAAVLSGGVDGVLFVSRVGRVSKGEVALAFDELRKVGANVLGSVLNGAGSIGSGYYYYGSGYLSDRRATPV